MLLRKSLYSTFDEQAALSVPADPNLEQHQLGAFCKRHNAAEGSQNRSVADA